MHNGIIENYRELKEKFLSGHEIKSETDTKILAHLIEVFYAGNLRLAVAKALSEVRGTYGLVAMHKNEPGKFITARLGSPIAIGVGKDEYFIASDTSPMLAYTQNVIFLDDKEIAEVSENNFQIFTLKNQAVNKTIEKIDWNEAQAERGGFPHFMLKEIFDQPMAVEDAIRGRYDLADGTAHLGGLNMTVQEMHSIKRIILIACGTAYYAAMAGKNAFERLAGIPAQVEIASEFRYSEPILDVRTLVFGISQSGETADTLAALREAKRRGAFVRGIVNVVGSTIARETDGGTYIHAGPELSVASTKAYTNMIAVLFLYALQFGRLSRVSGASGSIYLRDLADIPSKMKSVLEKSEEIKTIAEKFKNYKNFYYLGRGVNFPCALEGSLKL
ncbi:MAG: isomerizing glutamine--fructose-6-phosphate transaminase, partial [Patescibacteria group bacterium]